MNIIVCASICVNVVQILCDLLGGGEGLSKDQDMAKKGLHNFLTLPFGVRLFYNCDHSHVPLKSVKIVFFTPCLLSKTTYQHNKEEIACLLWPLQFLSLACLVFGSVSLWISVRKLV